MDNNQKTSTVNVVASSSTGNKIDLEDISENIDQTSYNPDEFPGLVYRLDDPDVSTLLFNSGKIVATGAEAVDEAQVAIESVFEKLRNYGVDVDDSRSVRIENIVTSSELGSILNLNAVAIGLGVENVEYEPEQFPGLIYRLDDPDVCALLFGSGQVVISGGNKEGEADIAIEKVRNELEKLDLLD